MFIRSIKRHVTHAMVLSAGSLAHAEPPELVTDRPDQTESSVTVPPGYVQIEAGLGYGEDDEDSKVRTLWFPGTLIRIGLHERLELRVGFSGWEKEFEEDEEGFGNAELGTKLYLFEESGWRPEAALLTSVSIPIGEEGHSSERFDPSFRLSFSHTLSEKLSLGYNLGVAWETFEEDEPLNYAETQVRDMVTGLVVDSLSDPAVIGGGELRSTVASALLEQAFAEVDFGLAGSDRDTVSRFQYTAVLGIDLTPRLGMFVELFGDVPLSAPGGPAHAFDGGFTFLVRDNIQLDVACGVALSDDADDWFIGAGISYRWPR